ncbi:MAG: hypothetical protein QXR58_00980 [Candidatus Micrarchaeaceae archaeon]
MRANSATGYALLVVGVIILLFTFYQAYTIFVQIMNGTFPLLASQQPLSQTAGTGQNVSIQNAVSSAVSSALAGLHINVYATIVILLGVLALFASIGYKFAKIGVEMIKSGAPQIQKQEDKKQK